MQGLRFAHPRRLLRSLWTYAMAAAIFLTLASLPDAAISTVGLGAVWPSWWDIGFVVFLLVFVALGLTRVAARHRRIMSASASDAYNSTETRAAFFLEWERDRPGPF
jgi:hypothetical protein